MKHKWILSLPMLFNISSRKGICSLSSSKFLLTKSSTLPFFDSSFIFHTNCRTSQVCSSLQFTRQCSNSSDGDDILPNIEYEELTVDMFKELIKNEDDENTIRDILYSYELLKFETGFVPSTLTVENMELLLQLSHNKREKTFNLLLNRELNREKRRNKPPQPYPERHPHLEVERAAGRQQIMGVRFDDTTGAPLYGEWLNSHFLRLRKSELQHSFENNLITGYMFGPKLVIDCDYELSIIETRKIVWDIFYAIKAVSKQTFPFNIMLTGPFSEACKKTMKQTMISNDPELGYLGAQMIEQNFMDLFPKDDIIYLSPYAPNALKKYDPEKVYVLGGLPDVMSTLDRAGSFPKCKSLGIKAYRLPLDYYFVFKKSKKLSLRECVTILDHLKDNQDIGAALNHGVDSCRYKTKEELEVESKQRTERILKRSLRELNKTLNRTKFV